MGSVSLTGDLGMPCMSLVYRQGFQGIKFVYGPDQRLCPACATIIWHGVVHFVCVLWCIITYPLNFCSEPEDHAQSISTRD